MNESVVKIGLLGASRIAVDAIIRRTADIDSVEVSRIAASSMDKARQYATEHEIPGIEDDYAALVTSDDVDLVYNALPPSGHMQWSIAALEAGKHVLCEKPFAMNAVQSRRMVDAAAATGRTLIEAFHYRFHPLFARVLEVLRSGQIGSIQSLASHFTVPIPYRSGDFRHEVDVGGGALMDLGCYPVHWVRAVMGTEPAVLSASAVQESDGVDVAMTATLEFPGQVKAEVSCSMQADLRTGFDAELAVQGDRGTMTVINPLSPHSRHELIVEDGSGRTSETVDGNSTYFHQLEHVVEVLRGDAKAITGGPDAIANMALIDAIYRAAGMLPRGMNA